MDIRQELELLADAPYAEFMARLLPTLPRESILGVRLPVLRVFARSLNKERSFDGALFLSQLPHATLEENYLHAFLIAGLKTEPIALRECERFLPYIDNWAVCDSFRPKALRKNPETAYPHYLEWLQSEHLFTRRFAIGGLLRDFLDERFLPEITERVLAADLPERQGHPDRLDAADGDLYYLRVMVAWYLAEALIKQWDRTLPLLESGRLDRWLQRKCLQKAVESRRLSADRKACLKALRP